MSAPRPTPQDRPPTGGAESAADGSGSALPAPSRLRDDGGEAFIIAVVAYLFGGLMGFLAGLP